MTASTLPHRVLVVGHYPPWPQPGAAATRATVERLLQAGHDVSVLSDRPSAAHDHADLHGTPGALAVARRAGDFDAVVVHLEPELFGSTDVGRGRRALARVALGTALRRWKTSVVAVDLSRYFSDVAALPSRKIWEAATEIWVSNEHDRRRLVGAGVAAERVVLSDTVDGDAPSRQVEAPWVVSDASPRDAVLTELRDRAAARATTDANAPAPPPPAWPEHPAPVRSRAGGGRGLATTRLRARGYASLARRAAAKAVRTVRGA